MLVLLVILFGVLFVWLAATDLRKRSYWKRRGVIQAEPVSLLSPLAFLQSFTIGLPRVCELYNSSDSPLLGVYKGRSPALMVRDPELVWRVMRSDFQHFADKRQPIAIDKAVDPLSQHLIGLTGEKWKSVRSKLTPVFSSGKVKESIPLIREAVDNFMSNLGEEPVETYPATVSLVTDVILSYAFGLESDSPERTSVRAMGFRAIRSDPWVSVRRAVRFHFPWLFRLLGLKAFDPAVTGFFTGFVREALAGRRRVPARADFFNRLLRMDIQLPEDEREGLLAAQMFSFFTAGFETTCFTLTSCLYELCKHPEVVEKARQQLNTIIQKHGTFTYEAIKETTYINQIIKESMRMYPADFVTPRICTKPYTFEEVGLTVEEGTELLIPGFCLSRDEKYFPQPMNFDPERFSSQNKEKIIPGTYLPFGEGPRQCIAMRFSLLEIEYILSRLIIEYDMELAPGTPDNMEFNKDTRVTHFKDHVLIKFKKKMIEDGK